MSTLQVLHRRVLIPTFETVIKRRAIFRHWANLERTQWMSASELQQLQLAALIPLLRHAEQSCPYFAERWASLGLHGASVRSLADFQHWPITRKADIRLHRQRMVSTQPGLRIMAKATGGSTGAPVQFALDAGSYDRRFAAWHRGYSWSGAGPGSRQLYLWGVPIGKLSLKKQLKETLYHRLYRRKLFNTFQLSDTEVPRFVRLLNSYRPEALVAYTGPLYAVARLLEQEGIRPYSPKAIVVGAEKLHDFQRRQIERVFRAPVFETYGSREFMLVAAECERRQGLHLTAEHLIVEIIDDQGRAVANGVEGNIVITDLYNYGMPFIRYETGDRAIAAVSACSCGRGLPMLQKVVGRQLDVLTTTDGRKIPGEFFPHLIKEFPAVTNFQVVQISPGRIEVKLVANETWSDSVRQRLVTEIRGVVGNTSELEIVRVSDIPLTPAGKRQVVINKVSGSVAV